MSDTNRAGNAESAPGDTAAHFVALSLIQNAHAGKLGAYMKATGSRDVVITMPVKMEVAGPQRAAFLCCVGGHMGILTAREPLSDAAAADCPKGHKCLFGWVPAHRFGHDDFGIYIDDIGVGRDIAERHDCRNYRAGGCRVGHCGMVRLTGLHVWCPRIALNNSGLVPSPVPTSCAR